MKEVVVNRKSLLFVMIIMLAGVLFTGGCARYARTVDVLYSPSTAARGGAGDVFVVIPESQLTQLSQVKWVIGKVTDNDNQRVDELLSARSPSEIIQSAFGQELKAAGYTVIPATKLPESAQRVVDITKAEIELDQVSRFADIRAKCRVLAGLDVYRNGRLLKRLQYEASDSRIDIKDRDLLAGELLQDTLRSLMLKAMPDLNNLFIK